MVKERLRMKEKGSSAGKKAFIVIFALVAVLVLVNGIILLCESDPAQFYSTLFH
jgi:ABC-type uncharacterized transport system permease subunit